MNTRRIYSIRDKKLNQFMNLCFFDNDAVATRSFGDLVSRDTESIIHQHPSDFSLCYIGDFDTECGSILQPQAGIVVLCDADSFIVSK